ncbi:MAG TPA: zf-HC2 domain-containing protein [Usitatibacter sp.]|nr:zf-HC2 domain-containing protein [Usitatibacter sp.]
MITEEPCPKIEALSALTDGELREAERIAIEAHAAGCPLCAPALARLRRLRSDFAALPQPAREFDVAADVDRRIGEMTARPSPKRPRIARGRWWQAALLAPAGAVAVGVGVWLGALLVPASVAMPSAQMAAFSALPPGALCPAPGSCGRAP